MYHVYVNKRDKKECHYFQTKDVAEDFVNSFPEAKRNGTYVDVDRSRQQSIIYVSNEKFPYRRMPDIVEKAIYDDDYHMYVYFNRRNIPEEIFNKIRLHKGFVTKGETDSYCVFSKGNKDFSSIDFLYPVPDNICCCYATDVTETSFNCSKLCDKFKQSETYQKEERLRLISEAESERLRLISEAESERLRLISERKSQYEFRQAMQDKFYLCIYCDQHSRNDGDDHYNLIGYFDTMSELESRLYTALCNHNKASSYVIVRNDIIIKYKIRDGSRKKPNKPAIFVDCYRSDEEYGECDQDGERQSDQVRQSDQDGERQSDQDRTYENCKYENYDSDRGREVRDLNNERMKTRIVFVQLTTNPHTGATIVKPYKPKGKRVANPYASKPVTNPYASTLVANPYASKPVTNPYASTLVANPYASKPVTNPYASKTDECLSK
jgi:hypothetical protein